MEYNLELINKYINGEDLEGYNVDELENNPIFMKQVIVASNDKNMYNLCSESVKQNYDFVSFLINKYSSDIKFIDEVGSNYIYANHNQADLASICVKMSKILEKKDEYLFAKYRIKLLAVYMTEILSIELLRENGKDPRFGLGFIILEEIFNSREDALEEMTVQFINSLFEDTIQDFEEILHKEFNNPSEIDKIGIVKYMIDFLRRYDVLLADYVSVHKGVLKDFEERIKHIQRRWKYYVNEEESYDYEVMFDKVHEYMQKHYIECTMEEDELYYYIGKELGITSKIAMYLGYTLEDYNLNNSERDEKAFRKSLENLKNRIIYSNVKKIIVETLFGNKEEENNEGKVIEVDFSKTRK